MPARAPRAPRAPRQAAATGGGRKPRGTAAAVEREATPIPEEAAEDEAPEPYSPLQKTIASVFNQAQKTTAGHRKLVINLRSVFDQCIQGTGSIGGTIGVQGRQGEKMFVREFCRFLNRVLVVKKSEVVGDRCLRLADLFIANLAGVETKSKKNAKDKKKPAIAATAADSQATDGDAADADGDVEMGEEAPEEPEEPKEFVETEASRAILRIINHLLPFLGAREKIVRYRTTQFIALMLTNSLREFPFDHSAVSVKIFEQLGMALSQRINDKEAIVRQQAAIGLARLYEMGVTTGSDDENSDEEENADGLSGIVRLLLDAIQNDPSADVRRTILFNLSAEQKTLPFLLERSRDIDTATRKAVFARLLPSIPDFRRLTIGMREKLLRWGLTDRDESVRQAAQKLFNYRWIDNTNGDLLEVLERLDVINEPLEGGPKYLALKGFWENRKDVLESMQLGEEFWENLTPEGAFLARSMNDYCRTAADAKNLDIDERMPEVTRLAVYLQKYINKLIAATKIGAEEVDNLEFIVQQLLIIAMTMDYGDEIGRRKMFALLRECVGVVELSETVTKLIVQGLSKLATSENDFCYLMLEVISEIHETYAEDDEDGDADSFHSAQSDPEQYDEDLVKDKPLKKSTTTTKEPKIKIEGEKSNNKKRTRDDDSDVDMMDVDANSDASSAEDESKILKELEANLKCLYVAQCMLENVRGVLRVNNHLVSLLNGLVVPAVRSHDAPVREAGMRCLGLACLIDLSLAESNLMLFHHCFTRGNERVRVTALHVLSDILMTHGELPFNSPECTITPSALYKTLGKAIKSADAVTELQSTAVEVVCKLMLAGILKDEELLKALVVAYFDPTNAENQSLRQTLSYFFPVFCHSSSANALLLAGVAVNIFHTLLILRQTWIDDEEDMEMISPTLIAAQLIDWTDPRKTVVPASRGAVQETVVDATPHAIVARDALERMCVSGCNKEERKFLVNAFVGKCYLPKEAGKELLREVYENVTEAIEMKVVAEAAGRNTLAKVEGQVAKLLAELQEEEGADLTMAPGVAAEDMEDDNEGETVMPEKTLGDDDLLQQAAAEEQEMEQEMEQKDEDDETPNVTEDEDED
ncbi:Similar to Condensin complex subunit 3; acc. no. Q10429 [Pyronema omphalodes CBS 100304]|uniref:Similar to Condensin complex subunit 3 acc. no. Q10429 n=1 Tax=Pyronema omphalodes (strain CBS 100304) TaxID=1076935 RepID=U4L681_PYROM|nr:Similar to Condensin complex subunit 3; acc. no. Q10429 [Pyronema omphalodes CBS 100304]